MAPKKCANCKLSQNQTADDFQQCSRCKNRVYCSRDCQREDWPTHKANCRAPLSNGEVWYEKYRKCKDGSLHEGRLELITWDCPKDGTAWGNIVPEEADDLKRKFEEEFEGDERRLFKHWRQAFRWTCCGTDAGINYGCDHHGTGSKPCTCDFCKMGQRLPDSIYHEQSPGRMGLTNLARGPDPRSYNAAQAAIASAARSFLGMPGN